jgi:type II secretory pathway pseudopilin PulG
MGNAVASIRSRTTRRTGERRRGFTLIEMVVAGSVAVIVIGAITISLSKIGRGREVASDRLNAHLRASAALDTVRRNVASVMRSADLFETRLLITDGTAGGRGGDFDRDEILLFTNRLAAVRPGDKYQGEGSEYETQIRIMEDELGSALWERRDPVPDRNPEGGGVAIPLVDGVVGLQLEAYDGESWYPDWDSDLYGLPWAVRATVVASGERMTGDLLAETGAYVVLRTTVAIDRIVPPPTEEEEESKEENALTEEEQAAEDEALGGGGVGGGGVAGPGDDLGGGPGLGAGGDGVPVGGPRGGGARGGRGGGGNGFISRGGRGARGPAGGMGQSRPGGPS